MKNLFFLIFLSLLIVPQAVFAADYSLAVRFTNSKWSGEESKQNFDASTTVVDLSGKIHHQRFYGGLNISGGKYNFPDNGPNHPNNVTYDHDKPLTKNSVDLIAGYEFWSHGSVFIGTKSIEIIWPNNDKITWAGVGAGLHAFHPLSSKWISYGSFSLMPMFVDANDKAAGRGAYVGLELGVNYLLGKRFYLHGGLRAENLSYQIENESNNYGFGGLTFGAGVSF